MPGGFWRLPLSRSLTFSRFSDVVRERVESRGRARGGRSVRSRLILRHPPYRDALASPNVRLAHDRTSRWGCAVSDGTPNATRPGLTRARLRTIRLDKPHGLAKGVKSCGELTASGRKEGHSRTTPGRRSAGDSSSSRRKGGRRGDSSPETERPKKKREPVSPREREIRRRQEGDSLVEISPRRQSSSGHPVPIGEGAPEPPEPLE